MSGVLDRMVQRTRGELPAVEPLVPPQWTALPTSAVISEETLMREAPLRLDHEASLLLHTPRLESTPLPKPQPPSNLSAAEESARATVGETSRNRSRASSPTAHEPLRDAESHPTQADPSEASDRVAANASQNSATPESRDPEVPTVNAASAASDGQPESPVKPPAVLPPLRHKPQDNLKSPPAVSTRADSAPGLDAGGEHTEIHITIGSIELHAPPAAPKAPPFRPRVTLDDFLSRRRGAAS